jgi:peptidoglycan hydrolase CwlO-like protein
MPLKPPRSVKTIEAGKALFAIALFCVVTAPLIQTAQAASLEELRAQKIEAENRAAELEKEADSKKGKVDELTALVSSLNKQIANYQALIAKTQYNIASTEKSIQETEAQIKEKEALLADNQAKQAEALQTMYVMGRKSTLESLITSQSLSEVVARDQYLSALEEKIENMMREIKQLKKDLETKRLNLSQKRQELLIQQEQQKAYKATIESQRNQQKVLLNGEFW